MMTNRPFFLITGALGVPSGVPVGVILEACEATEFSDVPGATSCFINVNLPFLTSLVVPVLAWSSDLADSSVGVGDESTKVNLPFFFNS